MGPSPTTSDAPRPSLDAELRALAGEGAGTSGDFTIRHNDHAIGVAYATDSDGNPSGVTLWARYDEVARARAQSYRDAPILKAARPLAIELRRENVADQRAKRSGLSVEWQSGDDAFDRLVYVNTPTSDPAVLAAVVGPGVRAGVMALLRLGFSSVAIDDDGRVNAYLAAPPYDAPGGDTAVSRGARAVEAFAQILANLPAVVHSGESRRTEPLAGWTALLTAVGLAGWLLNVGYVGLVAMVVHLVRTGGRGEPPTLPALAFVALVAWGLLAGWLGSRAYGRAVARRVQGLSSAHTRVGRARLAAFGGFSVAAFTVAFVLALALHG